MTAVEFIDAIEAKKLLPSAMLDKLRQKVASSSSKPLTAKSLARFLIEKGHLSKEDVVAVLAAGGEIAEPPAPVILPSGEPSGIDLPVETLQDLSSSAEWSMEDSSGGGFAEPEPATATVEGKNKNKKKKPKGKNENEWDSPLLLIGGGALVLLLIVGPLIGYILFAENADKILAEARKAMQEGAYGNAIANYEKFVEDYKGNSEFSAARVELAMARIRQTLEAGGPELGFKTADVELRAIANESAFNKAEEELSGLLPQIARGLADRAEKNENLEETKSQFENATTALGWANNTKYIPKSRRDNTDLEEIRETLDRIQRRQQSLSDLETGLAAIEKAIAEGNTGAAFAVQEELIEKHPTLLNNEKLAESLQKISAAERQGVQFVAEAIPAATDERNQSILATLTVANRRASSPAPTEGVVCAQVSGIAYGLDASSGNVLWRRYLGPSLRPMDPVYVDNDILLVDWRPSKEGKSQQALLRVEAKTGKLIWRLELEDKIATPVLSGPDILLAGESGKLHVVTASDGTRKGFVNFAQPLRTPPTIASNGVAYLAGDHSSVYSLSTKDYSCLGVYYTNHGRESIAAPAAVVLDKVLLIENDGAETCQLRVYSMNQEGAIDKSLADHRLAGCVMRQPIVEGRRVAVLTDRGQIAVYDIGVGAEGESLTLIAKRPERNGKPFVRYGNIADGIIWFGEAALAKFAVAPTGNQLVVQALANDYNRSEFVGPIEVRDKVVFHARSRRSRAGYSITACSAKDGTPYWETDVAAPPAANPLASTAPVALLESDANGLVYRLDPDAIRTRAQNEALPNPNVDAEPVIYQSAQLLKGGAAVFAASGSDQALLYSPTGNRPLNPVRLPAALAGRPIAYGDGWIAPLSVGQVFYLDAQTGRPLAAPFQPPLEAGKAIAWQTPAVTEEGQVIVSDGVSNVYLLDASGGAAALTAAAQAPVSGAAIVGGFATIGQVAVAATEGDRLLVFRLPTLEAGEPLNAGGSVVWGPFAVGDNILLATSTSLMAINREGAVAWQVAISDTQFAGVPLAMGASLLVATQSGDIITFSQADGSETGRVSTGEPLAGGPVLLNNRIVVSTRDAALLVIQNP